MSHLLDNLLIFGRVLRRAGIDVHRGRLLDVMEALGHVNLGARDEVYHTCRALLVHRQEQIAIFDRAFAAFWREHHEGEARRNPPPDEARASAVDIKGVPALDEFGAPSRADEAEGDAKMTPSGLKDGSDLGGPADKPFAEFTTHETAPRAATRRRPGSGVAVGAVLVGRDANWRSRERVPSTVEPPSPEWRSCGPAHIRWLGSRGSGGVRRPDRAAPKKLPSVGVAEPPHRHGRLRALDARTPGRAAVCGRFPAGTNVNQSFRPGHTLERARLTRAEGQLMEISGSYTFNAPPDRVWDLLLDPAVISSCIPGCERFEPDGEDRYTVTLTVSLAAITGTYNGTVVLTDKIPHTSYRLMVEGQGRPGFVKGSSAIALRAQGVTTAVDVTGTVQTGGPIARLGQRLIGGVAKMMLDRFFACLQAKLGAP